MTHPLYIVQQKLCQNLESGASHWREMKREAHSEHEQWQCKAKASLLREACELIQKIPLPENQTELEFYQDVLSAIFNCTDWGWGSNWPDSAQDAALRLVKQTIVNSIPDTVKDTLPEEFIQSIWRLKMFWERYQQKQT